MGSGGTSGQVLAVVAFVAAGLLLPAGVSKLRHPAIARDALGIPRLGHDGPVRLVGSLELIVAAWVLLDGSRAALGSLGIAYATFALVAARQRRRGASCGCFGAAAAPTSWGHVGLNAVVALCAGTLAIAGSSTTAVRSLLDAGPAQGAALLLGLTAAVASAQLILTALPDLAAARRGTAIGVRR